VTRWSWEAAAPRTVRGTPTLLADSQRLLRSMGMLEWSAEI
jgi:hypothetical protein